MWYKISQIYKKGGEMSWLHIRDPIHGFIRLNELEKEIIQTFPFQRLRFVHQLGTTPWAYPSGVHTRFVHSLGVLQMASLILDRFKFLRIGINEEDEKFLELLVFFMILDTLHSLMSVRI